MMMEDILKEEEEIKRELIETIWLVLFGDW